jgi:hypothetical protein
VTTKYLQQIQRIISLTDSDFSSVSSLTGHGTVPMNEKEPAYLSTTIWKDKASFDQWRKGSAFQKAHGQNPGSSSANEGKAQESPKPLWSRPPQPVFYEGTLVITNERGA